MPGRRFMPLLSSPAELWAQLRRAGDECWRAGQLVLFFLVAGVVFSAPPAYSPIFTPVVFPGGTAARLLEVRAVEIAVEPVSPPAPTAGSASTPAAVSR